MVPPPDNTGDEFPDFENMSFEEQMAWLESLAKRQGAGADELTTAADLDIPVPEDAEVDEPGYVPFEGSRSAREMQQAAAAAPPPPEPEAAPVDEGVSVEEESEELAEAMAEAGEDPMHWLDSLAAQPEHEEVEADLFEALDQVDEEEQPELEAVSEDQEGVEAETEELFAELDAMDDEAEPVSELPAAEAPGSDDPLGGMDPMAWLESLAKRQGANAAEFTTTADLEIGDVPEDTVVDEPGYVPFEGSRSAREIQAARQAQETAASQPAEPEEEAPEEVEAPEPEAAAELPELAEAAAEELVESDESMEWLESLAKRQGASEEELVTDAELEIPELPEDTVVDEPGYVAFDEFEAAQGELEAETDELAGVLDFGEETADEGLSWLEDLAAEPDEDVADFLAFEDEGAGEEPVSEPEPAAPVESDDPLAGMSDEDIARAQAQGTLTPMQELAWLKRQARSLAETREPGEAVESVEDVGPAEPGDIPEWLEEIRQTSEEEAVAVADAALGDVEAEDESLPDWLQEPEALSEEQAEAVTEVSMGEDVDSLWEETEDAATAAADLDLSMPDSELAAFVSGDFVPTETDPLAEALDEEYERRMEGDTEEPEWYTEAVANVAAEAPALTEAEAGEEEEEPALAAAEPVESPGWLASEAGQEDEEEFEAQELFETDDSEMPDWLRGAEEEPAAVANETLPDWLVSEEEPEAARAELPDWLSGAEAEEQEVETETVVEAEEPEAAELPVVEEPEPAAVVPQPEPELPVPAEEVAPEVPAPVTEAPLPEGELFEQYRVRLEANAEDYPSRLALARALRSNDRVTAGLDHYEVLIESGQLLQDIVADLSDMVEANPDMPRMQRLLGDAYMRQGKLAEALAAYRDALHQL